MAYEFIKPQGVFIPDTANLQQEVEHEYKTTFGADLVVTPDTPQGVLIAQETLSRAGVLSIIAQFSNQINPNVSEGVWLDALLALTGSRREQSTKTFVENVVLSGVPSSIIPAGALAALSVAPYEQFELTTSILIDAGGTGIGTFRAINSGSIVCDANQLTQIITAAIGWEAVNNPDAATYTGTETESDEQARSRRRNTLAANAVTTSEAIISGLYLLDGVRSVSYLENRTNAPVVIDGVNLVAHSIWACVDGGSDQQIAETLLAKKSCGSNWNGSVTENVTDPWSGQVYPVQFERPTDVPIMIRVTVRASGGVADPITTVRKAIMDYANGLVNSESGLTIGIPASSFEIAGAINYQTPLIFVSNLEVALLSVTPAWLQIIPIGRTEKATIQEADIAVTLL